MSANPVLCPTAAAAAAAATTIPAITTNTTGTLLSCDLSSCGPLVRWLHEQGCNRDTVVFSMVNSDWRDRAKAGLEKILAPEDGGSKKAKAAAKAAAKAIAAAKKAS